jgi:hypothetical protein
VVTNSMRVAAEVRDSPRTVKPTTSPRRVPVNVASRLAAARAAIRRGWVTMMRPGSVPAVPADPAVPAKYSAIIGGTTVVLPVPGGASTTNLGAGAASARFSSSMSAAAGNPAPMRARSKVCGTDGSGMTPVSQVDVATPTITDARKARGTD